MGSYAIPLLVAAIGAGAEGAAMKEVAQGNNRFAFELYAKLRDRPGNLLFSPYSIATALAMTSVGANGPTAKQMVATLHLPEDPKSLDSGFAALRGLIGGDGSDRPYQLSTANALWGQQGLDYRAGFLERTEAGFGAGLREVDFRDDPQGARQTINAWVERQTRDKIKDLLAASDVSKETDLILTNAIYFKGSWAVPFSASATKDEPFRLGTSSSPVPTMHRTGDLAYGETETFQSISIPYLGDDLAMVVLLPRAVDGLAALESSITIEKLDGWPGQSGRRKVELSLPRFRLESSNELAKNLAELGMPLAFGPEADFSGIAGDRRLRISAVVHKAFAEVNEEGTEAAAATAVGMRRMAAFKEPTPPVVFKADHPFLFLIRDNRSGSILFLGRVVNPKG